MAQPLYFLPGVQREAIDNPVDFHRVISARGLSETFSDVQHANTNRSNLSGRGPFDKSGCIISYSTPAGKIPRRIGYYPKEQEWQMVDDGSQVVIGIDTAEPTKPEDLLRAKPNHRPSATVFPRFGGYRYALADGHEWMIPIVRRLDGSTELPRKMRMNGDGQLEEPIKAEFMPIYESLAEVVHAYGKADEPAEIPVERAFQLAIDIVSLNYRFSRIEQNTLSIIDRDNLQMILLLAIDAPRQVRENAPAETAKA